MSSRVESSEKQHRPDYEGNCKRDQSPGGNGSHGVITMLRLGAPDVHSPVR
jgi:hypothetical protein